MKFDIITIFPDIFDSYLNESILKRAQKNKLINLKIWNLRDFSSDKKHHKVDDRPYGGGPGMVMQAEPIIKAVKATLKNKNKKAKVIFFSPAGKIFNNKKAEEFLKKNNQLIFVCGRYEGIDARAIKALKVEGIKIEELSVGPYVLTGGELPAMVLIDVISRRIKGVLGKEESLEEGRFGIGTPSYTRPVEFNVKNKKYSVPKVLIGGNHAEIDKWRIQTTPKKGKVE